MCASIPTIPTMRNTTMYLMWFDDSPKRPAAEKIAAAVEAYTRHFGVAPSVVLVNEADREATAAGVRVDVASFVRRDNYWVGRDE